MTLVNPEHWPPQIMGAVDDKVSVVKDLWICVWGDINILSSIQLTKPHKLRAIVEGSMNH